MELVRSICLPKRSAHAPELFDVAESHAYSSDIKNGRGQHGKVEIGGAPSLTLGRYLRDNLNAALVVGGK